MTVARWISSQLMRHYTDFVTKDHTAPLWQVGATAFMWSVAYLPWEREVQQHTASDHAPDSSPAHLWSSRTGWWKRPCLWSWRSFSEGLQSTQPTLFKMGTFLHMNSWDLQLIQKKTTCWQLTERVPLILPDSLREVYWQISGERWRRVVVFYWSAALNQSCGCKQHKKRMPRISTGMKWVWYHRLSVATPSQIKHPTPLQPPPTRPPTLLWSSLKTSWGFCYYSLPFCAESKK